MGQHPRIRLLASLRENSLTPRFPGALKPTLWLVWVGSPAVAVFGQGWVSLLGAAVFLLTLGAHLVEFFAYRPMLERAGGSMVHHFVQTLLYGFFHLVPVQRELAERAGDRD